MSELRSSYEEAEKESSLMENKGSEIQEHFTIPIYQTNLPVVANILQVLFFKLREKRFSRTKVLRITQ